MKNLNLGIFGFGSVGQGLYFAINNSTGIKTNIKKIVVKNKNKERSIPIENFSFDKNAILNDPEINVVVELIDDAVEAYEIVKAAIIKGKHVVTANKKMLATHLTELLELKDKHQVSLLYEASACGSIPIIRTLEEYFDNEALLKISGVFNGTTNYILTKVVNDGITYEQALSNAQASGFAESDPTNDVEGFDALYKTIILSLHGFGAIINESDMLRFGISTLHANDINYAQKNNYKIKLVPTITQLENNKINAFVIPQFVNNQSHLYKIDNEFNGVLIESPTSGEQFMLGRGAGSKPTGAAVLSDISALSYNYYYENKKLKQQHQLQFSNDVTLKVFVSSTQKSILQKIKFNAIEENFNTNGYHYVIGQINTQQLKPLIEDIRNDIFLAVID
jgi:homoserine dehydrogenase